MSNFRYPYGNEKILNGEIPWNTAPIVAVLVGTQFYHPDTIHQHLVDIPDAAIVAISGTLTGRTSTLGVADADDITWGTVAASTTRADAVALVNYTGTNTTSVLIAWMDNLVGVPVYPDGSDITCRWDNGANKVFIL